MNGGARGGGKPLTRHLRQPEIQVIAAAVLATATAALLWEYDYYGRAALALIGGASAIFLVLFTGRHSIPKGRAMVAFSYLFVICAFLATTLPFYGITYEKWQLERFMYTNPMGVLKGCMIGEDAPSEVQCLPSPTEPGTPLPPSADHQWVLNIGGVVHTDATAPRDGAKGWPTAKISNGLVVPLYVVIIALMGGAVSMTRRIPEIQRRLSNYYTLYGNGTPPPREAFEGNDHLLPPELARERLVFQMMQFLSAPLIAIAGFHIIQPESQSATVAVAFISGFASETILNMIRALSNWLTPENPVATRSNKPSPPQPEA